MENEKAPIDRDLLQLTCDEDLLRVLIMEVRKLNNKTKYLHETLIKSHEVVEQINNTIKECIE